MPIIPLEPFRDPLDTLARFGVSIPTDAVLFIALGIVLAIWLIYTLVVTYHWLKYSHGSLVAYPAIIVHVAVSITFFSYALGMSLIPALL